MLSVDFSTPITVYFVVHNNNMVSEYFFYCANVYIYYYYFFMEPVDFLSVVILVSIFNTTISLDEGNLLYFLTTVHSEDTKHVRFLMSDTDLPRAELEG